MAVLAITPIQHGESDGTVRNIAVGEDISSLDEQFLRQLVEGGSAIETGQSKYNSPLTPEGGVVVFDEETRKRDELITKALMDSLKSGDQPSPAVSDAASTTPSIGQEIAGMQVASQLQAQKDAEAQAAQDAAKAKK